MRGHDIQKSTRIPVLVAVLWLSAAVTSAATTATWTDGAPNDSYSDPDNWSTSVFPCNDVDTFDVVIPDGSGTVNVDVTCVVETLSLGTASTLRILGTGDLSVNGQTDIAGIIDDDGGVFTATVAAFPGDQARVLGSAGGAVEIGASSYASSGLTSTTIVLEATGGLTTVDLSSLQSIAANFDDGLVGPSTHTVSASGGGTIDLSGLDSLALPVRPEDWLEFRANNGTIQLDSLATLPAAGGRTQFDLLNASELSLPSLVTADDTQVIAGSGARLLVNGPGQSVTYRTNTAFGSGTEILFASGANTLIDLSAVDDFDIGFDLGGGSWY
ncbi:MAG: hypothetical protein R3344_15885, partial [Acidobacteriota bacterium]|nr:hypothetical protein [Acidobacteriota bacterium]